MDVVNGDNEESGEEGEEDVLGEAQGVHEEGALWSRSWPLGERMVKDGRSRRTASVTEPMRRGDMGEHLEGEVKKGCLLCIDDLSCFCCCCCCWFELVMIRRIARRWAAFCARLVELVLRIKPT